MAIIKYVAEYKLFDALTVPDIELEVYCHFEIDELVIDSIHIRDIVGDYELVKDCALNYELTKQLKNDIIFFQFAVDAIDPKTFQYNN